MRSAELLQDWATRSAQRSPEAKAVVHGDQSLTYGELEAESNRLARALHGAGCRPGDRVAMLAPKSPRAIAAIVGVYKAGAILVPLDPDSPSPRQAPIVRSCEPWCVLATGGERAADRVRQLFQDGVLRAGDRLGWLGEPREAAERGLAPLFTEHDVAREPASPSPRRGTGEDPAHILYTSGSTGEPKGVVVRHCSAVAFVDWALRHFGIGSDERVSGLSPLHFDLSTFDIFGAFGAGAELHLIGPELALLPKHLADYIRRRALTQLFAVPSILNYMARFDVVAQDDFPALRRLMWCGEVFPTPALIYWMKRLPHVSFTNLYGPTETTVASSFHDVLGCPEDEREQVPIGRPCAGEELLVLDADLRPVAPGVTGDLYIGGVGLSPGYWRDPERTAEVFVDDPRRQGRIYRTGDLARIDDRGRVYFVGRSDSQIKSRGYRIELGEIESAVAATGLALESVVAAVSTDGFEGQQICCAYVPAADTESDPAALRRALRRLLPAYMVPTRWQSWPRLPRGPSGKLDRKGVRDHFAAEVADGAAGGRLVPGGGARPDGGIWQGGADAAR